MFWVMAVSADSGYRLSQENITFVFRTETGQVDTTTLLKIQHHSTSD
jgi:hypothetical protein